MGGGSTPGLSVRADGEPGAGTLVFGGISTRNCSPLESRAVTSVLRRNDTILKVPGRGSETGFGTLQADRGWPLAVSDSAHGLRSTGQGSGIY
jgi:hypothetical protein